MEDVSLLTVQSVLGTALGVVISVVLPVLWAYIKRDFVATQGVPPWLPKYARLALFSFIVAIVVLAGYDATHPETELSFLGAVLLGFGWEASVEKLARPALGVAEKNGGSRRRPQTGEG
jgi:hypothetical protein